MENKFGLNGVQIAGPWVPGQQPSVDSQDCANGDSSGTGSPVSNNEWLPMIGPGHENSASEGDVEANANNVTLECSSENSDSA